MKPDICRKCGKEIKSRKRLKIQARKGTCYTFCSECFENLRYEDYKKIRLLIKENKIWR